MLRVSYALIEAVPDQPEGLPLSAYRLRQLSVLRPSLRRRQGIGAELLLIRALRQFRPDWPVPLSISVDENGKPFLPDSGMFFSLSHSGAYAACALSDRPVGLDLERETAPRPPLLRRCFSAAEQEYIRSSSNPSAAFTQLWTGKESLGKATGAGLRAVRPEQDLLKLPAEIGLWHTAVEDLHLSVCVLGGDPFPELLERVSLP